MRALKENGINPAGENVVVAGAEVPPRHLIRPGGKRCLPDYFEPEPGMDRARDLAARINRIFHKGNLRSGVK